MWTNNDQNAIELYGAMQQVLKHNNIFLIFYTVIYHTGDTGKHYTVNTVKFGGTLRIQLNTHFISHSKIVNVD